MKMNLRNMIRIIVLVPLAIFFMYCIYFTLSGERGKTYKDCGTIVSKEQLIGASGKHLTTNVYLNIQFEKSGFKSIPTSVTDYFQRKEGERVCYDIDYERELKDEIFFLIGLILITVIIVLLLFLLIFYLFDL